MRRFRFALVLTALLLPSAAEALADPDANGGPKVRPYDTRSANLLLEGVRRSPTLRAIVDEIEARRTIVYIEQQPLIKRGLAGKTTWLATTERYRFLRISMNPELSGPLAIATLGHELQHALEIAREPSIVDDRTLEAFYRATGISMRSHTNGWDTMAAREVGDEVRREVVGTGLPQITRRSERLDPAAWAFEYRQALESFR